MNSRLTTSKLHMGCFDRVVRGWHNTDITPHLWVARVPFLSTLLGAAGIIGPERLQQHRLGVFRQVHYLDVRKPFPYPDSSMDAVFSSHFLEHLFPDEAKHCLQEVHRVLRPGGVCRVVVPDLDLIVARYDPGNPSAFLKLIFEEGQGKSKNLHHWHYNASSLIRLLEEIGFKETYRCEFREGRCPDIELLDNRPDDSLFVEAIKDDRPSSLDTGRERP